MVRRFMSFSALGRAVWDETDVVIEMVTPAPAFSALGRAVWDETQTGMVCSFLAFPPFSALGRAVWDETQTLVRSAGNRRHFQCSRSSRMG